MRLRLLALFTAAVVVVSCLGMTTAAGRGYTYDAPTIARVDVDDFGVAAASTALLGDLREWSALPSAQARGASTTPFDFSVATEAGMPGTVRHYTTSEFADSISKGGEITPGPVSGRTWLTPDEYLDGATAQSRLALNKAPDGYFEIPMCRVGCPSSPSVVKPYNGQPGGGIEITTNSPIDVTGLPFTHFGVR